MSKMVFHINKENLISEVQKLFAGHFPFLRITFFKSGSNNDRIGQNAAYAPETKMKDILLDFQDGEFEINDEMTIPELETKFYAQFGLFVQIFRKSGNVWMAPNMTSFWTLRKQNEHGRDISPPEIERTVLFREVPFGC